MQTKQQQVAGENLLDTPMSRRDSLLSFAGIGLSLCFPALAALTGCHRPADQATPENVRPVNPAFHGILTNYQTFDRGYSGEYAIMASTAALSGKPFTNILAEYRNYPRAFSEEYALMASAAAISDQPFANILAEYQNHPRTFSGEYALMASAAALSGKPFANILAEYQNHPRAFSEEYALMTSAAAISDQPFANILANYQSAPRGYSEEYALMASAAELATARANLKPEGEPSQRVTPVAFDGFIILAGFAAAMRSE
jgi:hypothetical protein